MEVYLVIGYFKYEGCEPLCVCSTLDKAIAMCKLKVKEWDGVEVIKYTTDDDTKGIDLYSYTRSQWKDDTSGGE